jgi:hypothetical protein
LGKKKAPFVFLIKIKRIRSEPTVEEKKPI